MSLTFHYFHEKRIIFKRSKNRNIQDIQNITFHFNLDFSLKLFFADHWKLIKFYSKHFLDRLSQALNFK